MIQEIKYNGYTTNPSDRESPDGDLSNIMGLIPEDEALRPILPPKTIMELRNEWQVIYLHKVGNRTHYITKRESTLAFIIEDLYDADDEEFIDRIGEISSFRSITSVGNTLVVLTDDGIRYFLWSEDSNSYDDLGSSIPECPLIFGLQGAIHISEEFDISFNKIAADGGLFDEDDRQKVTNTILAHVNKFIADKSTNVGRFIFPFFVRYAYRLYDGSITHQSAPILMICSSGTTPQIATRYTFLDKYLLERAQCAVYAMVCDLWYRAENNSAVKKLRKWGNIVKSIDIFISAPLYTYNQNGECKSFGTPDTGYFLGAIPSMDNNYSSYYSKRDIASIYSSLNNKFNGAFAPILPIKEKEDIVKNIQSCNQFYFLKSINIESAELDSPAMNPIDVPKDYLQSLVARESLPDDYDSHDLIIPQYAFTYNSRLNIANINKRLFAGFSSLSAFAYQDRNNNPYVTGSGPITCYVYIRQDGKNIIVQNTPGSFCWDPWLLYFYYPNTNAYKAVICQDGYSDDQGAPYSKYCEIELTPHDYLNGAVYFEGWNGLRWIIGRPDISVSNDEQRTIGLPAKIYTSEVNNPFHFPLLGIYTVGMGSILGICSAVKALSQGQFGQFPLYAFTTDGVWALKVSDTGSYSARQPITRDVCINPDSITQIDNAVLFASDRGIMLISGSNSICISDTINNKEGFSLATFSHGEELIEKAEFANDVFDCLPFNAFIAECRMIYDYTRQRIVIYNPGCLYAYVYSFKSKQWGMAESRLCSNVNSYPRALAMEYGGKLVDISLADEESELRGLVLTRPIKLDNADMLKTVDTIIQRGVFHRGHVASVLYGSRDLFNWYLVFSSRDHYLRGFRGTPYKYFRIALICKLAPDESLFGCSVQYTPRLMNQPR